MKRTLPLGKYLLIGLGGYAESGKDAFADILTEQHGWQKDYMSRPLEHALLILNPWIKCEDQGFEKYQELHTRVGYAKSKENPEVRVLLQKLGTEVGRKMFGEDVWVKYAERKINQGLEFGYQISVTGIRYRNELHMIQRHGGLLVWMDRGGVPVNEHTSDNSLTPDDFDIIVDNSRTLKDLAQWVDRWYDASSVGAPSAG